MRVYGTFPKILFHDCKNWKYTHLEILHLEYILFSNHLLHFAQHQIQQYLLLNCIPTVPHLFLEEPLDS